MSELQLLLGRKVTFTARVIGGAPPKEVTKELSELGMTYYGQSKQWHVGGTQEQVLPLEQGMAVLRQMMTGQQA